MEYIGKDNLRILEETAPFYNRYLVETFKGVFEKFQIREDSKILDFGAGIGTLALEFQKHGFKNIHCLEIDSYQANICQSRSLLTYRDLQELKSRYRYLYMSNVLEHIDDDVDTLRDIIKFALSNDGVLLIYVPAFMSLFSDADLQVGHFRRYKRSTLEAVVRKAGMQVQDSYYVDSLGFLALWLLKYVFRKNLKLESNTSLIRIYDRFLFPLSKLGDRIGLRFLFGKNLFLIATREEKKA